MIKKFSKVETISFRDFMKKEQEITKREKNDVVTYSVVFMNPAAFFDPIVIGLSAAVLGIVLLEKQLASTGFFHIAEVISKMLNFIGPVAFLGAIAYFLAHNPIMFW
jgi:ABC-type enterochelin transport system permease subunit